MNLVKSLVGSKGYPLFRSWQDDTVSPELLLAHKSYVYNLNDNEMMRYISSYP